MSILERGGNLGEKNRKEWLKRAKTHLEKKEKKYETLNNVEHTYTIHMGGKKIVISQQFLDSRTCYDASLGVATRPKAFRTVAFLVCSTNNNFPPPLHFRFIYLCQKKEKKVVFRTHFSKLGVKLYTVLKQGIFFV